MVQEGVELGPWRSQQFKGIPELQKNGLQAVEEAWMTISRLRHFSVKFGRFLCFRGVQVDPGGVKLGLWRSKELRGSPELQKGGLRALEEAWMTTFIQVEALLESLDGRVLDTSGQVWSFSALLGRLKVVPGGVEVRPRRPDASKTRPSRDSNAST